MKYSKGFTIVSLLVASAIGIFIAGVAGKVYVDSKMAFNMRSAVAAANENARFAIDDMRRSLVMAGRDIPFFEDNDKIYAAADNDKRTFPAVGADGSIGVRVIVDRDSGSGDGTVGSSVLAVRYATGPSCAGNITAISTIRFFINADDELVCEVTVGAGAANAQPIISGIVQMRALYGVDDDADGFANRFVTAAVVNAGSDWPSVVAIRIGLLASSGEFQIPGSYRASAPRTYDLLGMTVTAPDTNRYYKTATTTISLRNLNNGISRQ